MNRYRDHLLLQYRNNMVEAFLKTAIISIYVKVNLRTSISMAQISSNLLNLHLQATDIILLIIIILISTQLSTGSASPKFTC